MSILAKRLLCLLFSRTALSLFSVFSRLVAVYLISGSEDTRLSANLVLAPTER